MWTNQRGGNKGFESRSRTGGEKRGNKTLKNLWYRNKFDPIRDNVDLFFQFYIDGLKFHDPEFQFTEIEEHFPQNPDSSDHSISKRQSAVIKSNVTSLSCSTPGNCVMLGKFCPHPDKPSTTAANGIYHKLFFFNVNI